MILGLHGWGAGTVRLQGEAQPHCPHMSGVHLLLLEFTEKGPCLLILPSPAQGFEEHSSSSPARWVLPD